MKKNIATTILLISLTSCATVFGGTNQKVNVQATDSKTGEILKEASCRVTDGDGMTHQVPGNPGVVQLGKTYGSLKVECTATGYKQKAISAGNKFNPVTIANVLFFPGFIVDGLTGAAVKHPSHFNVIMEKQ